MHASSSIGHHLGVGNSPDLSCNRAQRPPLELEKNTKPVALARRQKLCVGFLVDESPLTQKVSHQRAHDLGCVRPLDDAPEALV